MALSTRHVEADRRARETAAAAWYPMVVAHLGALLLPLPDLLAGRPGRALLWALAILGPVYLFRLGQHLARRAAERSPSQGRRNGVMRLFLTKAAIEEADARALTALGWLHDAGVPHGPSIDGPSVPPSGFFMPPLSSDPLLPPPSVDVPFPSCASHAQRSMSPRTKRLSMELMITDTVAVELQKRVCSRCTRSGPKVQPLTPLYEEFLRSSFVECGVAFTAASLHGAPESGVT